MAKDIRSGRTQVSGGSPRTVAPTEHSQLVARPVAERVSKSTGMDQLSQAFGRFFGQAMGAAESMEAGINAVERERIRQENEAQKKNAAADFFGGADMDPDQVNDLDYYDTYRSLLADKTGMEAGEEFRQWYLKEWAPANPTGDLAAARDEYLKVNLMGGEDKGFEAETAVAFIRATDGLITKQRELALQNQIHQGKETLEAVIAADAKAGNVTPERMAYYVDAARTLNPLAPHEASPMVAAAITTAIKDNPGQSFALLNVLEQPGTGVNGKSFAESFPQAFSDLQSQAVTDHQAVNTLEELHAVNALKDQVPKLPTYTDEELADFNSDLIIVRETYGAGSAIDSLHGDVAKEMERRAEFETNMAMVEGMFRGDVAMDVSHMEKFFNEYLKVMGVTSVLQGKPEEMGELLIRSQGNVPADVKSQISASMLSFENPQAQAKAVALLEAVTSGRDAAFARTFLSDEATRYFDHIVLSSTLTNDPMEAIIERANMTRRQDSKIKSWTEVTGAKLEVVNTLIDTNINDAMGMGGWGPGGARDLALSIPFEVRERISDYALQTVIELGSAGVSWEDAVKTATLRVAERMEIIPQGDAYVLSLDTDRSPVWFDEGGVGHKRIRLGFDVPNDTTRKHVNTIEVYQGELAQVTLFSPWALMPDMPVVLRDRPETNLNGSYAVEQNGDAVVFTPGEAFTYDRPTGRVPPAGAGMSREMVTETLTIPNTAEEMSAMFDGRFPPGFGFIPITMGDGSDGWMLSYRPHFGDEAGITIEERRNDFSQPEEIPQGFRGTDPRANPPAATPTDPANLNRGRGYQRRRPTTRTTDRF